MDFLIFYGFLVLKSQRTLHISPLQVGYWASVGNILQGSIIIWQISLPSVQSDYWIHVPFSLNGSCVGHISSQDKKILRTWLTFMLPFEQLCPRNLGTLWHFLLPTASGPVEKLSPVWDKNWSCYKGTSLYSHLGPLLQTKIRAWFCNYILSFLWDVITHPCHNFNSGLSKPPLSGLAKPHLKLWQGWVYCITFFLTHWPLGDFDYILDE